MAIKDVRQYFYTMQAQYLEMKSDLIDFEEALQNGFITEDQLTEACSEVARLENNYDRLTYIMYLLEMPNRASKKSKYKEQNQELARYFSSKQADIEAVKQENQSALTNLRKELRKLSASKTKND